ncbi:GATA zinc finger domain-containing protein 14-like [Salvia divinorum]|uniref:GATA zinc finger domain-containing protein 14-like n=1 Tax=Salvia divinorum TaxID=28513 RepID=A0ABD1GMN1_SALDI
MEMDYQQANAMGNWNPGGHWNQNGGWVPKQRDAPWRDHPNFRWAEPNSTPSPQLSSNAQQPTEEKPHWPNRNNEGANNWNRGQGQQGNQAPNHHLNSSQGPSGQYNQSHGSGGNFHPQQGQGYNHHGGYQGNFQYNQGHVYNHPGSGSSQPFPRQQNRPTDDLMGDLLNSQQHIQSNMQANNDVVHKLQDAQLEQKAAMDMLARQLAQIATSINELRGNEGKIPATVKTPNKENINQITLRSGRAYEGPEMSIGNGKCSKEGGEDKLVKQTGQAGDNYELRKEDLLKPIPPMADLSFLDQEPEVAYEGRKEKEEVPPESSIK